MHQLSLAIALIMLGAFAFVAMQPLFQRRPMPWRRRLGTVVSSVLIILGIFGFCGNAISAMGGLTWLPQSFEWPAGYCGNIVTAPDGTRIVAHVSSRIQLYDPNWSFIRGWHVDVSGGVYHVSAVDNDTLEVVSARGQQRRVYRHDGTLVSSDRYASSRMPPPHPSNHGGWVPTVPWLLGFTHPIAGWSLIAGGIIVSILLGKAANEGADSTLSES